MGTAAEIAMTELASEVAHASSLRQLFLDLVVARVPSAVVNAAASPRLPGNLSLSLPGIDADHLVGTLQPHLADRRLADHDIIRKVGAGHRLRCKRRRER